MARKSNSKKNAQTKGQRREELERKREERSLRNTIKKQKEYNAADDVDFLSFDNQLRSQGLFIKDVVGDGNCLFRSFADQMIGDVKMHGKQRQDTVSYMKLHRDDFEPFLDETMSFDRYIQNLATSGTYGGNDSTVAFSRHNEVDVIIHQFNSPTFIINGCSVADKRNITIHLAYHNYEHYSSVRNLNDPGTGPAYLYHTELGSTSENPINNETVSMSAPLTKRQRKRAAKQPNSKIQTETFYKESSNTDISSIESTEQIIHKEQGTKPDFNIRSSSELAQNPDEEISCMMQSVDLQDVNSHETKQETIEIYCECQLEQTQLDISKQCLGYLEPSTDLLVIKDESNENISDKDTTLSNDQSIPCSNENTTNLDISKKQTRIHDKPISSRQRKEQAKKDRKKNREEARKKEFVKENSTSHVVQQNIKCINI